MAVGGYNALAKALFEMTPEDIINQVTNSGLRGRGGASFPAGKKWIGLPPPDPVKYVVCNADEGDPGAFMDCSVMEGDPHRMIEGMIIAGIAVGAEVGYIRPCRVSPGRGQTDHSHRPGQTNSACWAKISLAAARTDLSLSRGAGAFVCGEGSAPNSIEGKRGIPRPKPPRLVERGVRQTHRPEQRRDLCQRPHDNREGRGLVPASAAGSPGTKTFSLTGNIKHTGLIEGPHGHHSAHHNLRYRRRPEEETVNSRPSDRRTFRRLPHRAASRPAPGLRFRQTGGSHHRLGGLVVMGEDTCMVEIARFFMNTKKESCGKCTTCRRAFPHPGDTGRITKGQGKMEDLDMMQELADTIKTCSLCGLGKTAPTPSFPPCAISGTRYVAHVRTRDAPPASARICASSA